MAVGIGCDVFLNGVPAITPKKINDEINKAIKNNNHINNYDLLINVYKDMIIKSKKRKRKHLQ
jgi:hypothetical protein